MKQFTSGMLLKGFATFSLLVSPAVSVFGENIAEGTCGTGVKWSLDDETLTIKGEGMMNDFENPTNSNSTLPSWNPYKKYIKHLVIEDGVTYVGDYAFYGYDKLEDINFGNGVTRLGNRVFYNCKGLTQLNLPESMEQIGDKWTNYSDYGGTFYGCSGLKELTLPAHLKFIGANGFSQCTDLEKIFWNATDCEVDVTGYSTHDVFSYCPLQEVDFGKDVVSIPERAFYTNGGLTTVKTQGSIEYVGNEAFAGTKWLGNQEIGMVYIDHAAYIYKDDSAVDDPIIVTLPEGTKSLSPRAFLGNKKLVKITIPTTLDRIGRATFNGCSSLGNVVWNADSVNITDDYYYGGSLFTSALSKIAFGDQVRYIPKLMLHNCSGLSEIKLPNSLREIGEKAFYQCDGITELVIPDGVTTIGTQVFYGLENVQNLTVGKNAQNVDGYYMFSNCPHLKTINWNAVNANVKIVASSDCSYTTFETAHFGEDVERIPNSIFSRAPKLSEVTLGAKVKTIGAGAFYEVNNLKKINIPETLDSIGDNALYNTSLEKIFIPRNVVYVGDRSLSIPALKEAIFAPAVAPVGYNAFVYADNVTIYVPDYEGYSKNSSLAYFASKMKPMVTAETSEFEKEKDESIAPKFSCNIPGYKLVNIDLSTLDSSVGNHHANLEASFEGERNFTTSIGFDYQVKEIDTGVDNVSVSPSVLIRGGKGEIIIRFGSAKTLDVFAASGQKVKSVRAKAGEEKRLSVKPGIYVIGKEKILVK